MKVLEARFSEGYAVAARSSQQWSAIVARLRSVMLDAKRTGDAVIVGYANGSYSVTVTADTLKPHIWGTWVTGFPSGNSNVEHLEFYLRELLPDIRAHLATA